MNKIILASIGVALLVGLGVGYAVFHSKNLSASITAYNCLNNAALCNSLNSIVADINTLNAPLQNVSSTSVTLDFPSVNAASSSATTTTFSGAALGDFILVGNGSSTPDVDFQAYVQAAGVIEMIAVNQSSSAINPAAQIFTLRDLPAASFARTGAIVTTTSTSF